MGRLPRVVLAIGLATLAGAIALAVWRAMPPSSPIPRPAAPSGAPVTPNEAALPVPEPHHNEAASTTLRERNTPEAALAGSALRHWVYLEERALASASASAPEATEVVRALRAAQRSPQLVPLHPAWQASVEGLAEVRRDHALQGDPIATEHVDALTLLHQAHPEAGQER